ncbi:uncharacterized protein LOC113866291 [Abrus precatorius]|uniref:Uncharacterized protein LOC113866291 n=1 Tax=Abrus precatorius TaxID=3816 RepID=A0A8B8LLZ3_ABRPR|nr:uncharacterized protein LOC113866291 [Abrus precatorius]
MPRKKQQCGFRIPWRSGPSTNVRFHRPPFRPPGIASAPSQPPPRTQSQQLSNSLPSQSPPSSVIIDTPEPNMKELELDNAATENSNSNAPLETQSKSNKSKCKANDTKHRESVPRQKAELHTTAPTSRADKKQKETRETVEGKMMFATSNPGGNDIKVVNPASTSSDPNPATMNVSTIPLSNEENPIMQNNKKDEILTVAMDEKGVSVVTLAGDNRGVTMHVAGSSRSNPKTEKEKDEAAKAYVNSNIQSINNSIMSHGTIQGRDPGVRVVLPQHPEPDNEARLEPHKGEVSINRAERLPYQPVVRRRCLRGLFLEPSESEGDNPDKPRRHGCKFRCGENSAKDKG